MPLILVTNDDGIESPGLLAAIQAVRGLGDLLVAAPTRQWSGAGRAFARETSGAIFPRMLEVDGEAIPAFAIDGTPAQVVLHALLELAPCPLDLVVVGINYGENPGADVTCSGTIGAALQGATWGIPALAVSRQAPKEAHLNLSDQVDFTVAAHFTRYFACRMLEVALPFDVDILKVDVPDHATPATPWRLTRQSRQTYFRPVPPRREDLSQPGRMDYEAAWDIQNLEPDSDIYALVVDRVVAVTPLSLDLTSRTDLATIAQLLRDDEE
ncbi:MAG: 5'/3'-nucleotidase SurE [Anaerolineae bacterium]|nr:5'/3'-nucleotidase SurE [Anaerolineae bacterium]MDW8069331.1 5'/3'-nucleotidase SurE [Anaerolineae bacterium]